MLPGFTPWPPETVARYRARGWWQDLLVSDIVAGQSRLRPDKVAIIEGDLQLDYASLQRRVERLARRLAATGLEARDRVVMQLPNSTGFVVAYLALTRIGAIPVMALRAHRHSEVRHFIQSAGAVAYMIPDLIQRFDYREMAAQLGPECPTLRQVLVLGEPLGGQTDLRGLMAMDDDPALDAQPLARPDPADVATMLLSGGTTSMSKLIPRTHLDYVLNARLCAQAAGFDEQTVFMALLPLGHNYNLASPGLLGAFQAGGTLLIGAGMDAESVFPLVAQHRVSVIAAAVPLITQWLASPVPALHDLSSLKIIQNGGARLAPELRQRIRSQFGCFAQEIYGTAEGLINMTRPDDPPDLALESSGAPVCEDDEIKVLDEEGREVPDGEPGELVTRGPYTIQGYYNAGDKNREAFTPDGFYRMGDIVRKRGRHVFAEGRKKDLINRGGEKISCEEVENLIFRHPAVHQVALVAMPDPVFGEKACAFVVTKPGQSLDFASLIRFLRDQQIASFKLPERLELIEQFPTSLVGKILKRQLREMITDKLAQEGGATP